MELCDAPAPTVPGFNAAPFFGQNYELEPHTATTMGLQFPYLTCNKYPIQNDQQLSPAFRQNMLPARTCQPTLPYAANAASFYSNTLLALNSGPVAYAQYNYLDHTRPPNGKTSALHAFPVSTIAQNTLNGDPIFQQLTGSNNTSSSDSRFGNRVNEDNGDAKSCRNSRASSMKCVSQDYDPDLLMHQSSSSIQWDVNDPKLPKIRQFDTFTMWPQGQCRYAYQKSSSDGARRHASGWAMRNTNNHNAQILKKSCLGVLLCTAKGCSLAMRPAICDKARRRQEGRPCCMPNCNGRIYNQPCRGHGGYPVTHFWREHGDTVYFQAKGTHDHVRPDLKPVRDTAARRRRQIQLDKLQQNRLNELPETHNKQYTTASQCRKRRGTEVDNMNSPLKHRIATGNMRHPGQWKGVETLYPRAEYYQCVLGNAPRRPEPVFPKLPNSDSFISEEPSATGGFIYQDVCATYGSGITSPGLHKPNMNHNNQFEQLEKPVEKHQGPTLTEMGTNEAKPIDLQSIIPEQNKSKQNLEFSFSVSNGVNPAPFYKQQLFPSCMNQGNLTFSIGAHSESTSGGLNASWSTPSPPTGGSSSLFGGEFKTMQSSGFEEMTANALGMINNETKDKQGCTPIMTSMQGWHQEFLRSSYQHQPNCSYGLSTPIQFNNEAHVSTKNTSPESILTASALMSASTPVGGGHAQAHQLAMRCPNGYIPPISFNLNSSSSRTTQSTSSESEQSNNQPQ